MSFQCAPSTRRAACDGTATTASGKPSSSRSVSLMVILARIWSGRRSALSAKRVGGRKNCCLECERPRGETDGMPTGARGRFTLRDKAATLVRLSEGASFRDASEFAPQRRLRSLQP